MCIPRDELADLVGQTIPRAAPLERAHLATTIDTIRQTNITARLDSPKSRFLRNLTDQHLGFFINEVETLLKRTEIFGVDLPIVNAIPRTKDGRRQVILFNGLLQTVRYYADLTTVLNLMLQRRSNATLVIDDDKQQETVQFSSAAFAGLAGAIDMQRPLPAIRGLLGPRARKNATIGYLFALLFIIAHEVGHLHLGHLKFSPKVSERLPVSFAIPELLTRYQANELEADGFALQAFREESRESIIPSVLFFLGPFAFLEAFAQTELDYPLSVNRLEHVRGLIAQDSEAAKISGEVLRSSVAGFHRLATLRGKSGSELRRHIHETMPPERADWVFREVARRIRSEMGCLETDC